MDRSLFEKYIAEMRAMQAVSMPPPHMEAPQPPVKAESIPNSPDMTGEGYLTVNVTSVRGLYPVEGARVTVFTGDGENEKVITAVTTDQSGKTPRLVLPTPASALSQQPDPDSRPFAYYNIRTAADGFVENSNYNVAIFDGVNSLQNIDLLPLTTGVGGNRPIVINEADDYEL